MQEYLIPEYMNITDRWYQESLIYESYPRNDDPIMKGELPTNEQVVKLREIDNNGKKLYSTARRLWDPDKKKWLVKDVKEYRTDETRCSRDFRDMKRKLRSKYREHGIDPDSVR